MKSVIEKLIDHKKNNGSSKKGDINTIRYISNINIETNLYTAAFQFFYR